MEWIGSLCAGGSTVPTVLQEVNVRVTANSHCKDNYKSAGFQIMDNSMICAAAPGKDACRVHIARKMKWTFHKNLKREQTSNKMKLYFFVLGFQGDSGGPLIYRSQTGSWTQIGIVSFGIGTSWTRLCFTFLLNFNAQTMGWLVLKDCAHEKYPGVFTRVASFRQWIRRMANV
jgi:secreted trypsin-like serine protease